MTKLLKGHGIKLIKENTASQTEEIIKLCQEKIKDQKDREKGVIYGVDDYNDGRIVGAAALARRILSLLNVSFH